MRIVRYPPSDEDTVVHQLPEPDMIVDPRIIEERYKFKVTVNGTTLTITRTDPPENRDRSWDYQKQFRVYNINEDRYSFESTHYIYHGLENERAPLDTTEVIIKDGVKRIRPGAFYQCRSLVKVTIPDSVKRIEQSAFYYCDSLRFIQLPPNLEYIGEAAFFYCTSLETVFLPPTVKEIDDGAFRRCASLRILNVPDSVEDIGSYLMIGCKSLLTDKMAKATYKEQREWPRNRYNPLHNLCCQPSPSPQAILQYIQGHSDNEVRARTNDKPQFTALHLLAANPSVTGDMITAYLQLAPDVATMQDSIGMTPLHMLCSRPYFSNSTRDAIRAYLSFSEGKEAAFMMDDEDRKPLEYIYSENTSFASLMMWWYDCLGMSIF